MDGKQQSPVSAGDTATSKARERDRREGIGLGTAEEPSSVTQSDLTSLSAALEHEKIAVLANRYWHERGCPKAQRKRIGSGLNRKNAMSSKSVPDLTVLPYV